MNVSNAIRSEPRAVRTHSLSIGQAVRLKSDLVPQFQRVDVYRIVGKLPPLGESPQYRIRSEAEPYDRVATEDRLEPVAPPLASDRSSLTAKVFSDD